jgi:hypothetical protein
MIEIIRFITILIALMYYCTFENLVLNGDSLYNHVTLHGHKYPAWPILVAALFP